MPELIPLPEDENPELLGPEWIPLPKDDDLDLLVSEWIPLPQDKDPELLMPESIPLPSDDELDLLPDLLNSDDLDLALKGPMTMLPTPARRESRARPPRGAPKAPKAMLALNGRRGGGPPGLAVVGVRTANLRSRVSFLCGASVSRIGENFYAHIPRH